MKNLGKTKNAQVQKALPVPATAAAGKCVILGTAGLRGLCLTDRAAADANGKLGGAVGVPVNSATVELLGVHTTVKVNFAGAVGQFVAVYVDAVTGDYTLNANAGANKQVGATLEALAGAGVAEVALF